ncbi:tRNA (adenosine(37)-N6)-threonylcarbamoyltransferase complex dimerization subunit type 1 TsaB [Lacimicrobium sp. SS2-24]|uniref:tRNA (adenosine(37)-N6)-threonylcarbamoyltransferase complex dimerization subunit type 1 TsaB n=1 Tax=Lacimicrobium sp. SS2-24 TaxID=2005569 RepID=UPI000B4BE44E|nr:tRNA (adenosine(37)-N6)-threonylcarbamoyltransferase complex dimerization subunit type 1 TsaB [Lacimicrobium sp. SS2-24]
MKNILAIDTATEACSVALMLNSGTAEQVIFERFELCPQQHSQRLLPMVDELLSEAQVTLKSLDMLAFGRGPGSFTGVRIATGMIQGLAFGTQLPVVGVSTLAAMAQQALEEQQQHHVAAAIDARMDEVYLGCYQHADGLMVPVTQEQVLPPSQAIETLEQGGAHWYGVGTGWGAYPALNQFRKTESVAQILYPRARYMLPLAIAAFARGEAVTAAKAEPVYLRDKVTWKKLPGR